MGFIGEPGNVDSLPGFFWPEILFEIYYCLPCVRIKTYVKYSTTVFESLLKALKNSCIAGYTLISTP